MKNILIIGATSSIARATAHIYAKQGHHLYLIARDSKRLTILEKDLKVHGAKNIYTDTFDAIQYKNHLSLVQKAFKKLGTIDIVLLAHGTLSNQKKCEDSFETTYEELSINAIGTISILTHIANQMEKQKKGTLAVITSVAGDRGRQSNYVYGSAKAMLSTFLEGLRNRLQKSNINVLDIRPGFVDTPMTATFSKGFLWAKPESIAKGIYQAIQKKKHIVYLPSFWKYIMWLIRNIPENIFIRLKL